MLLVTLIDLYSLIVLAAVVLSWVQVRRGNPLVDFVERVTEPLLAPIRRALPPLGGLDFSPMILLVGLQALRTLIVRGL